MGVSININVFIQMAGFLILLFLLNIILYKPILKNIRKRREEIDALKRQADDMMGQAKAMEENYNSQIKAVEEESKKKYEETIQQAYKEKDKLISEKNREIREKLMQEEKRIQQSLKDEIERVDNMAEELSEVAFLRVVGK